MKLVDALRNEVIGWDNLEPYQEETKEYEIGQYVIRVEKHMLSGYSGSAYAVELLEKDFPCDSYSWFSYKEVNSLAKLKQIVGV